MVVKLIPHNFIISMESIPHKFEESELFSKFRTIIFLITIIAHLTHENQS